ncbi:MAG: Rrf2 family transcriptional regulator, partial [Micrococcus sp.]|nr:Rrf2 family transcriptional regulator [Micrococcus sp.]
NATEIAAAQNIPRKYLLTVLGALRTGGLLESKRGVNGGFSLSRPASAISVADVIRVVDGPLADLGGQLVEDVDHGGSALALRDTWVALRAAMRDVLEVVTIQDLADQNLPSGVRALADRPDAWITRPEGLR